MTDLATIQAQFGVSSEPDPPAPPAIVPSSGVSAAYEKRLHSLVTAKGGTYQACLDRAHDYPSDSEADMAVICAMVVRHFQDGEIWATLQGSALYASRVERKGERHAINLYGKEIASARAQVQLFDDDPGADHPERRVVTVAAVSNNPDPVNNPDPIDNPNTTKPSNTTALGIPADDPAPTGNGFLARYIRYGSLITDAPREAHELMAMVTPSALAGPRVRLPIATSSTGWPLCLWAMYVVNSTVGRKTTTINIAKEIIANALGYEAMLEWEGSPQGMLQRLQARDGQTCVFARDEFSGLMSQMNKGGHMAGLAQLLIKAFDGGVLENIRTSKRRGKDEPLESDSDRVEQPYLPILAASTWDAFIQRCTIDNVLDGFLARFIFVTGAADPRPLQKQTAQILAERDALLQHARDFVAKAERLVEVDVDPDVLAELWDLEQAWLAEANESARPDAAAPAMKRLTEACLKVAALLAIDRTDSDALPTVTGDDFQVALTMGERWRTSTMQLIEALGSTSFMRDLEAVGMTVADRPQGIARRDHLRKHRRLRKREFDEILQTLEDREEIEIVEVNAQNNKGKRPLRVYPFGHAPQVMAGETV